MAVSDVIETTLASISAQPDVKTLLRNLHTQALDEQPYVSSDSQPVSAALDRFVALDPDKCAFIYLLLRSTGATNVVEAGTSFGLSTIYLALAVSQNASRLGRQGRVIATENEPSKASRAREHWQLAGPEIENCIELREGDLLETLKTDIPELDFVLLDIWAPLALPTLKLLQPRLKVGAMIAVDNSVISKGYAELHAYLDDATYGFRATNVPYSGGLRLAVYLGTS